MTRLNRYDYVTQTAVNTAGLNNSEQVRFHAFNPNGLVATKREINERIADLVKAGTVPSGWHVAYGTFADHYSDNHIYSLLKYDRVPSIQLSVWIDMKTNAIADAVNKISSVHEEIEA